MFILTKLKDNVRVEPADLGRPTAEAVTACLEGSFINKVIADVGLVVTLYDVLEVTGGHIYPSDGAAHFEVTFRILVFRPFVGEVIVGRLSDSHSQGVQVSLGFFDDVHIGHECLPDPSRYKPHEHGGGGEWFWQYEGDEMYLERDDPVRFRVREVVFEKPPTGAQLRMPEADDAPAGTTANPFAPMKVYGSIAEEGLGMTSWWEPAPEDMEE